MSKITPGINTTNRDDEPNKPGEYCFVYHNNKPCGIDYCCPCGGCGNSYLPFSGTELSTEPSWQFDGDMESPTLQPSILRTTPCKWHGYLTKGNFVEC